LVTCQKEFAMTVRKPVLLVSALLVAGCASPDLTNTTPSTTARTPSGLYPIRAEVEPKGNRLAHVHAIINGIAWPMMPLSGDDYAVGYFAGACEMAIPYKFSVGYQRRNILGSGYSSTINTKEFPEAGGYLLSLTGVPPEDCPAAIGLRFAVDSPSDAVDVAPGDGACRTMNNECTLRAAIMEANASPGHDYISVPPNNYILTLSGAESTDAPNDAVNDLDITEGLTLVGDSFAQRNEDLTTVINGNRLDRIFDIYAPSEQYVNLAYLRLENGRPANSGGGAIWNRGNLRMDRLALLNNRIEHDFAFSCAASVSTRICNRGGGLLNEGQALLFRSTVAGNSTGNVSGRGGGISNLGNEALLFVRRSLVNGNEASFNGGLANYAGRVEVLNTTFADNTSTTSGTVPAEIGNYDGTVTARNSTFHNRSTLFGNGGSGTITLGNSLVYIDSFSSIGICSGSLSSAGFNVIGGPSDLVSYLPGCGYSHSPLDRADARLSLPGLEHNGGPTRTIALHPRRADSPFFDPIDFGGVLCPETDQRGFARHDGECDPGAFER
jgi:hypothetical protein